MSPLDAIDRNILNILQEDGRLTNAELAERVHLSPSACLRRVRHLERAGVIDRYAMLVNPAAVGRGATVFVEITLAAQNEETLNLFESAVAACPEIMECHLMAGEADYMLRVAVADMADFARIHRQLLVRLPGVARAKSHIVLREICRRTAHRL